jgi:ELWxxDGT repeat protein
MDPHRSSSGWFSDSATPLSPSPAGSRPAAARPCLEALEDRTLPSISVSLLDNINPSGSSSPLGFCNVNGIVYFSANDGSHGQELWRTDGTPGGTYMLADINQTKTGASSNPANLFNYNGTLFFSANDGVHGNELWSSDGTTQGTKLFLDIDSGGSYSNSSPHDFININGKLFFAAFVAKDSSYELWESDGTPGNTHIVPNLDPNFCGLPTYLTNVNGTLFFDANDSLTIGTELWKYDNVQHGTVLVKDIATGNDNSSHPQFLTNVSGTLFFRALSGPPGQQQRGLWESDGTANGTKLVQSFAGGGIIIPYQLANVNGTLFFDAGTNGNYELWSATPTGGASQVKDINPGSAASVPVGLTNVNGTLLFTAYDPTDGYAVWRSNGTSSSTLPLKTIRADHFPTPSPIPYRANVNGTLFFATRDTGTSYELWATDGTAAGTGPITGTSLGPNPSPSYLYSADGMVFFSANDGTNGREPWVAQVVPDIQSVTTTTPNGTYGAGAAINITLNFAQPLTLADGNLTLTLSDGAVVRFAPFTNATTVSNTYTVELGQTSPHLDSASSLVLSTGATLTESNGATASLAIGKGLASSSDLVIDASVPAVDSVTTTTPNGTYGRGAAINVTVNFTKAVTLAGGNLIVNLNDGGTVTIAPFTNATIAAGTYTVAGGDHTAQLDTISPLILASGATLRDAAGNDTDLHIGRSLAVGSNLVIDAVAPAITSVTTTTLNGAYKAGSAINITVHFSKAVTLAGGNLTLNLNDGGTVTIFPFANATSAAGIYTVQAGQNTPRLDTISPAVLGSGATLRDALGNDGTLSIGRGLAASSSLVIDTVSPTVKAIGLGSPNPFTGASAIFVVTFSEPVTGVSAANFTLVNTGLSSNPAIVSVTGSGTTWTVLVSAGTGNGSLGLNLTSSMGVVDLAGNPLSSGPFTGPAYTVTRPVEEVFVLGLDNQVYAEKFGSNSSPTGGYFLTRPGQVQALTVGHDASGQPEVFVLGLDNQVYAQTFDANGNSTSGYFLTAPGKVKSMAVGADAANHPELFVIGLDNQVYAQKLSANGSALGHYFLAGIGPVLSIAVGAVAGGAPELFILGLDNQVYAEMFDTGGNPVSHYFLAAPGRVKSFVVGRDANNHPELFALGLDNQVYAARFDPAGHPAGGYFLVTPGQVKALAVGTDGSSRPELFVQGLDSQVYGHKFGSSGLPLGSYFLTRSMPVQVLAVGSDDSGDPALFALGLDGQAYGQMFDASGNSASGYFLVSPGRVKSVSSTR